MDKDESKRERGARVKMVGTGSDIPSKSICTSKGAGSWNHGVGLEETELLELYGGGDDSNPALDHFRFIPIVAREYVADEVF